LKDTPVCGFLLPGVSEGIIIIIAAIMPLKIFKPFGAGTPDGLLLRIPRHKTGVLFKLQRLKYFKLFFRG